MTLHSYRCSPYKYQVSCWVIFSISSRLTSIVMPSIIPFMAIFNSRTIRFTALAVLDLKKLEFVKTLHTYLLTLPLCTGVSRVRALSPAWTGSPARETVISRTHLFLPHDLPPTKKISPDFEGPFRQLSKSSTREKNQVQ